MKIDKTSQRMMKAAARNRVVIDITAERIESSKRCCSSNCMTAQAIKAALPDVKNISVDQSTIRWTDPSTKLRITCLTPRPLQFAIGRYENGIDPEPMRVKLTPSFVTRAGKGRNAPGNRELAGPRNGPVPVAIGGTPPPLARERRKGPPPAISQGRSETVENSEFERQWPVNLSLRNQPDPSEQSRVLASPALSRSARNGAGHSQEMRG